MSINDTLKVVFAHRNYCILENHPSDGSYMCPRFKTGILE
jgi:hypothetical protein